MLKLNRLDGWERLSVVVGVLLALTVAIYAPYDETGTLQKRGFFKDVPWYGVTIEARRYFTDEEVFGVIPQQELHPQKGLFDDIPYLTARFIDARFTILFMALAAVLPYSLLAVVRWIAAGFKNVKG
jgi:hypothetical protein